MAFPTTGKEHYARFSKKVLTKKKQLFDMQIIRFSLGLI